MTIRPIELLEDMTDYEVVWGAGLPLEPNQTASEFYKHSSSFICEVKKDGFAVDIYCDGDMRYHSERHKVLITDGVELIAYEYDTDKKLTDAVETGELEHMYNPWFDLYVRGDHIDSVTHDINEALQSAKAWLEEEIINAKQIEDTIDIFA